jgi:hypothetical protein
MPLRRDRREARRQAAAIQGASKLAHSKRRSWNAVFDQALVWRSFASRVPIQLSPALVSWFLVFLIYGFIILVSASFNEALGQRP